MPAGTILLPSPLLDAELPDWLLLHFQANRAGVWRSPEVPSEAPEVTPASNRIALLPPMVRLREQAAAEHSGAAPLCSRRLGIAVQVHLAKSS